MRCASRGVLTQRRRSSSRSPRAARPPIRARLRSTLRRAGRGADKALALAEEELRTRADVFTLDAHAWALAAAGRAAEARDVIRRALAEGTEDARLFLHAGVIHGALGQRREARRWLNKAERLSATLLPSEADELSTQLRGTRLINNVKEECMTRQLHRTLPLIAAAGSCWRDRPQPARPVTWTHHSSRSTTRPTPPTSMRSFESRDGSKSLVTALGVYPFEEPGIGPNKFNFDDNVLYEIHVATGDDVAAGKPTVSYQFRFDTKFKNTKTILQSYLGVITGCRRRRAEPDAVLHGHQSRPSRPGGGRPLGRGVVPPNNQGNATPFYNRDDNGENPAKDGVATLDELDRYTQQSIANLDRGYVAFAGQRDDGFYADIQAVFDLLKLRKPGKDCAGRIQPAPDGAARFRSRSSAATGRWRASTRRPAAPLHDSVGRAAQLTEFRRLGAGRASGQPALQRGARRPRRQGSLQPDHAGERQGPLPEVRRKTRARDAPQPARARAGRRRHRDRPH